MRTFLTIFICISGMVSLQAQEVQRIEGQRKYTMTVQEGDDEAIKEFNRGVASNKNSRSFVSDIVGIYRSTFTGQIVSASNAFLEAGISAIANASKSKRPQWEAAVKGESKFVRALPMQMEILDFYKSPSTEGPLDPTDMLFTGFGCRQVIEYRVGKDSVRHEEVFDIRCKVRKDSIGISRMLNHSKFEIYVDYLSFNPGLCDLPNDSLGMDASKRIGFSFEKRKNLKFSVNATISSSWVNQAMQVFNDHPLGSFEIVAEIDPKYLDENGVFVYRHGLDEDSGKRVYVNGDAFLVPRSYVGTTDLEDHKDAWGTGQYKVEMRITESCQINTAYYTENGRWIKDKWYPEWQLIKSRRHAPSVFKPMLDVIRVNYVNGAWVTTLAEPMKTYLIQTENGLLNGANAAMPTSTGSGGKR